MEEEERGMTMSCVNHGDHVNCDNCALNNDLIELDIPNAYILIEKFESIDY